MDLFVRTPLLRTKLTETETKTQESLLIKSMHLFTLGTRGFFARMRQGALSATGRPVFGQRPKTRVVKPREKTSGAKCLDLLCWMDLDLVSNLSIKLVVAS